jgi:type VI secretion system secreted protein Hcp
MAVYLKIPDINGGATEANHKNWIRLESLQFGVSRNVSMRAGDLSDREKSQPSISEFHCTKHMDASSSDLFAWSVSSYNAKDCVVHVVSTGRSSDPFVQYTLTNAVISGYSVSSHGEAAPAESFTLSYTKIEQTYNKTGPNQQSSGPARVIFDIAALQKT